MSTATRRSRTAGTIGGFGFWISVFLAVVLLVIALDQFLGFRCTGGFGHLVRAVVALALAVALGIAAAYFAASLQRQARADLRSTPGVATTIKVRSRPDLFNDQGTWRQFFGWTWKAAVTAMIAYVVGSLAQTQTVSNEVSPITIVGYIVAAAATAVAGVSFVLMIIAAIRQVIRR